MSRTLLGVFLLVLVSCSYAIPYYETFCLDIGGEGGLGEGEGVGEGEAGSTVPDIYRTGLIDVVTGFDAAWSFKNPYYPGCGHLATYETEEEYNAIIESMLLAGTSSSLIGAYRVSGGDGTYTWGAGAQRGDTFVFIGINDRYANCFQEFCIPYDSQAPENYPVQPITDVDGQIGLNMVIYYVGNQLNVELVPASGSYCFTVEYPEVSEVAEVNGGPGLLLYYEKLPYFQMQETFIQEGGYVARVSDAVQQQWILDEFQCGAFNIWLGYVSERDNLRLATGPQDGEIIAVSGDQTCDQVYCNFATPHIFEEDEAVYLDTTTGNWNVRDRSNRYWALKQDEVCPEQQVAGVTAICVPSTTSDDWYQVVATADANAMVEAGTAFFPGGPFFFESDFDVFALYFDCGCNTDYRVSKRCAASSDVASCVLQQDDTSDISSQNSSFSTHSSLDHTSLE